MVCGWNDSKGRDGLPVHRDIVIIGSGPAGLSAALAARKLGTDCLVLEEAPSSGGQLVKQTHMFFGAETHRSGVRGFEIAREMVDEYASIGGELWTGASVIGLYPDKKLAVEKDGRLEVVTGNQVVVASGASEKPLLFHNCDLPGVVGAGAVQTLMNEYGIVPGKRVLMVGAGNIGIIVSYQLRQAGVEVAAIIDAAAVVGGYHVHAAKIRRTGVPLLTRHTIKEVCGTTSVEKAIVCKVDEAFQEIPGTEMEFEVDTVCLAVGLSPLTELLRQVGCRIIDVPSLGGMVAWRDRKMRTSVPGVLVAGDAAGIEEATSAMVEGTIAGTVAASAVLGEASLPDLEQRVSAFRDELDALRSGCFSCKVREGEEVLARCD